MTRLFNRAEIGAIVTSASFALLALLTGPLHHLAPMILITIAAIMVLWIAGQDVADYTIPDGPVVCLGVVGIADRMLGRTETFEQTVLSIALDILLCGGALWLVREIFFRLRGYDGLGFGDVKLAAAGGMLTGFLAFPWAVLAASVAGLVLALMSTFLRPKRYLEKLPFGALLGPAMWLVWVLDLRASL